VRTAIEGGNRSQAVDKNAMILAVKLRQKIKQFSIINDN
jgi:hypothetical protein